MIDAMIFPMNTARSEFAPAVVRYQVCDYWTICCSDEWKAVKPEDLSYYADRFEIAEKRIIDTSGRVGPAAERTLEIRIITRAPKVHNFRTKKEAMRFVKANYEVLQKAEKCFNLLF